ncbi:MAG: hypothetical protein H6713_18140 [Myxococcales bacterium]|nr:hypothetical protein [Myxococcales bacterium]MCB9751898.1 hypothetical protein [Myxococcales bacterium]
MGNAISFGGITIGRISFRSINGHYLVAEGGGGGPCNANRTAVGPWEKWSVWCENGWDWHVQASNAGGLSIGGNYLCLQDDGSVVANRQAAGPWETFCLFKYHEHDPGHDHQSSQTLTQNTGYAGYKELLSSNATLRDGDIVFLCRKALFLGSSQGVGGPSEPLTSPGILLADGGGGGAAHCWSTVFGEWQRWTIHVH